MKNYIEAFFFIVAIVLTTFVILEFTIALMLAFPSAMIPGFNPIVRSIYNSKYRNTIQVEPQCARYDPQLTYTLRPGHCSFNNVEFRSEYSINSLGLRDDEESLRSPEIIVLGDSAAMGWGVEQDQTYAEIIQKRTGMKVLNAAVASYGTVREMMSLDRLDSSRLQYLIIHYISNDDKENKSYFLHKNRFVIQQKDEYDEWVRRYLNKKKYYPGKYVRHVMGLIYRNAFSSDKKRVIAKKVAAKEGGRSAKALTGISVKCFLNAVMNASHVDLSKVKIVVVGHNSDFIVSLKDEIARGNYPRYIKDFLLIVVDFPRSDYYLLDYHFRPSGHMKTADKILEAMQR